MKKNVLSISISSILMMGTSFFLQAQEIEESSLEKIVVYGELNKGYLKSIPTSVTVVGSERITLKQAYHFEEIADLIPNINITSGASRGNFVQIRGIGERSQFSEPLNPSVALVIDGIDFSGIGSTATLFDVEQVEVLRGPQSISSGASGLAGLINVINKQPSAEQKGSISASFARFNTQKISAAYANAITDTIQFRVAAQYLVSDGDVYNQFLKQDDTNDLNEKMARVSVNYNQSNESEWQFRLHYFDIDNGFDKFSLDNDNITRSDDPGFDRNQTTAGSIKHNYQFNQFALVSLVSRADINTDYAFDEDWTFDGFSPAGYTSFDQYIRNTTVDSFDVRASSNDLTQVSATSTWLVGIFAKDTEQGLTRKYTFNTTDFTSEYSPTSYAVYGKAAFQPASNVELTFGSRVERFDLDYQDSSGFAESLDDYLFSGKATITLQAGSSHLFSSISRGYKAGGVNPSQRVLSNDRIFNAEYNWNGEVGVRGELSALDASVSVVLFYMQRDNAQVNDFSVLSRDDGSVEFFDVIKNADTGKNKGIEIEANWQATNNLSLDANIGYLEATFGGLVNAKGETVPSQRQAQSPKFTAFIGSYYQMTDSISWSFDMSAKDEFRFSDGHDEKAPFTLIVNSQVSWKEEQWSVNVWAKNLLDRVYYGRGFGGFSNDPRDNYANPQPYYQQAAQRQIGVTLGYTF